MTLNCNSDSNPPALNFSWFKENQSSAVGSGQSFIISSFNSSHSGRYYCEAQNQYGSQRSASVSVKGIHYKQTLFEFHLSLLWNDLHEHLVSGVQRAALHTLTGIVTGCGALIFIIIIIVIIVLIWSVKFAWTLKLSNFSECKTSTNLASHLEYINFFFLLYLMYLNTCL